MSLLSWLFGQKKKPSETPVSTTPVAPSSSVWSDNRTRLSDTPYLLPKDAAEDNRLDYQHYVIQFSLGTHYVAPIPQTLKRILDVGTGTGIWAIEIARQFPEAEVIGIDISDSSFKKDPPENCLLQTGNILEGLAFPDQTFNYTHQRFLVAAIPAARWRGVVHELVRITAPGGWVELLEINNIFQNAGPETMGLARWIGSVSQAMGFDANSVPSIGKWLTEEGLQRVETQDIVVPLGDWGGRAGALLKRDLLAGFDAARSVYCAQTKTPLEAFDKLIQTVAAEWEEYHTSYTFHASYGKRAAK